MTGSILIKRISQNEVFRFILSAGAGFLVDVFSFYLFYHNILVQKTYLIFNIEVHNFTISLASSFFLGVLVNFMMTKYMVFTESKSKSSKQFLRFAIVAIIGFFANWALVKLFVLQLGMYPPVARPAAALSLFFASYFVHKLFSFSLSLRHHTSK